MVWRLNSWNLKQIFVEDLLANDIRFFKNTRSFSREIEDYKEFFEQCLTGQAQPDKNQEKIRNFSQKGKRIS